MLAETCLLSTCCRENHQSCTNCVFEWTCACLMADWLLVCCSSNPICVLNPVAVINTPVMLLQSAKDEAQSKPRLSSSV